MINLYAYTYPSAMAKYDGYILTKVGDSTRDVDIRIDEQGGAAEYEKKITVHAWNKLTKIKRDHDVHRELDKLGLHHKDGKGTEWFKIPAETPDDVVAFLDIIVQRLEGKKVRNKVILRGLQQQKLDEATVLDLLGKLFDNEPTAATPQSVEYNMSEVQVSAEQAECFAAASYECDRLNQEVLQQIVSLAPAVKVEVLHGFMEVGYDADGEVYTDGSGIQGELLETFYYENGVLLDDGSNQVEKLIPQGWDYCYNETLFKWGCYN